MTKTVKKNPVPALQNTAVDKTSSLETAYGMIAEPDVVEAVSVPEKLSPVQSEILDAGGSAGSEEPLDDEIVEADFVEDAADIDLGGDAADMHVVRPELHEVPDKLPRLSRSSVPAHAQDALQLYLREISRYPLLEPDEEFELARRVRENGDRSAAFRLVSSHLRLVVKIAMEFQRRWMQNVLDLIQEGNVGLLRAVNKFEPEKDIKFSYYAAFWIRAYILKFIMDNWRMVKIGTTQAQRKLFYNLNKERQKLLTQGFDPDVRTLADRLGVKSEQVVEMEQRLDGSDVSLDAPLSDEAGSASRIETLPAVGPGIEESLAAREIGDMVRDQLKTVVDKLSEKERYILEHRLMTDDPVTLREIGERYHITRERVRQIEGRLLQKLRAHLAEHIGDFSPEWIG